MAEAEGDVILAPSSWTAFCDLRAAFHGMAGLIKLEAQEAEDDGLEERVLAADRLRALVLLAGCGSKALDRIAPEPCA